MLALKIFSFVCCPTHLHNDVFEEFRVNRTAFSADTVKFLEVSET